MHTKLPALAHDSLLFKNIGDEPVEKIIKLYTTFEKQIFIAFDKDTAYSDEAKEILNKSTVIRLDENGMNCLGRRGILRIRGWQCILANDKLWSCSSIRK